MLGAIEGIPVIVSEQMRLADTDGKVTAAGNGTNTGRLLIFNRTQWAQGFRRELTIDVDRDKQKRQTVRHRQLPPRAHRAQRRQVQRHPHRAPVRHHRRRVVRRSRAGGNPWERGGGPIPSPPLLWYNYPRPAPSHRGRVA